MFSPLEAAAYTGQLPEQRGQNAVNPQLKNLFAIQAAMDAKKHADEQLASALGQQTQSQPTVAQGLQQAAQQALRQDSKSPRDVAMQNMGLPGLMQGGQQSPQGQPPQGQPQGMMPQGQPQGQPPQQMASGGLADARSNLPSSYAGGGIVSFDAGGPTPAAPVSPADISDLEESTVANLQRRQSASPDAASIAEGLKYSAALGPGQQASIDAQQGGIDKLAALQAAKAANRPSQFWDTINAIGAKGSNVLPGQWGAGVAGAVQRTQEGYADEDIANQTKINTLVGAMNKAQEENNIGKYNAMHAAAVKVLTDAGMADHDATAMVDMYQRTQAQIENTKANVAGRSEDATYRADTLAQGYKIHAEQQALTREENQNKAAAVIVAHADEDARKMATKAAEAYDNDLMGKTKHPGETRSSIWINAYNQHMVGVKGFVPIPIEGQAAPGAAGASGAASGSPSDIQALLKKYPKG